MSILDNQFRSITCDGPGCTKTLLYDRKDEQATFAKPENIWLKSSRVTQTADGRNLMYCSDVCEVKGVETGKHNIPEPPKIIAQANPAALAAAAAAAQHAKEAEAAIRSGGSVKITD